MPKLNDKEFARFKELSKLAKGKKLSTELQAELDALTAKRNGRGSNDIKWWMHYPDLAKSVTNIAFNYIGGESFRLHGPISGNTVDLYNAGVAVIQYQQSIGACSKSSDAFNAQMRQLWLDMHRKYRGIGSYQRSDLGIFILSIWSLFATLAKFERIYGLLNSYKIANRNVPYTLFEALGVDVSVGDNLADFRAGLNYRISKMHQLCLPKGIDAIEAQLNLNLFVYKDAANQRAALFCFDPISYGVYDPTLISTGGCVKYIKFVNKMTGTTPDNRQGFIVQDMFGILDQQLNALLDDDDIAKMCSDLIAAYGDNQVMTVNSVPEEFSIEPVEDYERKVQFHNATVNGDVATKYNGTIMNGTAAQTLLAAGTKVVIYQEGDVIKNTITTSTGGGYDDLSSGITVLGGTASGVSFGLAKTDEIVLDTWVDVPSDVEIMCGTRMSALFSKEVSGATLGGGTVYWQDLECSGTEIVTNVMVFNKIGSSYYAQGFDYSIRPEGLLATDGPLLDYLTKLDWFPFIYYWNNLGQTFRIIGDVDNFTVVKAQDVSKLHDVALYSAFCIPSVTYIN